VRHFADLFQNLDTTTSTTAKVEAMSAYFESAEPGDAAWAVYILMGRRVKRNVGPALMRKWLVEEVNLPAWLIEETYASVGDLAETIALLRRGKADTQPCARRSSRLNEPASNHLGLPLFSPSTNAARTTSISAPRSCSRRMRSRMYSLSLV
jgi:hypothetical protein